MKKLIKEVGVDAGMIMIVDRSYLENLFNSEYIFPNPDAKLIKIKSGKYEVTWIIKDTWNGPITGEFTIEVTSGQIFISDPCYLVPEEKWSNFLEDIGCGNIVPQNTEIISSMGGDGCYDINLDFKEIK